MADDDKGPDLARGIASADLAEGAMLTGHVGEEEVLLVRNGGTVSALAAHCTHYHGPLAEGLIVGDTIRCPWHHACFSLRNGDALAAPALSPLDCWAVTERDGRIVVGAKKEPSKPKATRLLPSRHADADARHREVARRIRVAHRDRFRCMPLLRRSSARAPPLCRGRSPRPGGLQKRHDRPDESPI